MQTINPKRKETKPFSYHLMSLTLMVATVMVINTIFSLGLMYKNGQGVPQDYQEAVKWYRLSAEQGVREAQYNLGVMYYQGQGVPQDYKEAVRLYRLSAEQGQAEAQFNLGLMY